MLGGVRLRVATFNIRNGLARDGWDSWPLRRGATTRVLRGLDADLVGLQEAYAFQVRGLRRRLKVYGATGDGRDEDGGGERCTVLFRKQRLRLVDSSTRWFGPEPFAPGSKLPRATHPRIVTIVDLAPVDGGPTVTVANTHLDQRYEDNKEAAARQLAGWLGDGPTIVMGDLNAYPDSDTVRTLLDAGLTTALPGNDPGTNHDYGRRERPNRIDHILVSHHFTIGEGRVVTDKPKGRWPSDHWPVVVDLELTT